MDKIVAALRFLFQKGNADTGGNKKHTMLALQDGAAGPLLRDMEYPDNPPVAFFGDNPQAYIGGGGPLW